MSLSSFCVVTNSLRLNLIDVYNASNDKRVSNTSINSENSQQINNADKEKMEELKMTKTMKIEGMMCPHCEGRVRDALNALDCVEAAEVSHKDGTAVVTGKDGCTAEILTATVEGAGYKVISAE